MRQQSKPFDKKSQKNCNEKNGSVKFLCYLVLTFLLQFFHYRTSERFKLLSFYRKSMQKCNKLIFHLHSVSIANYKCETCLVQFWTVRQRHERQAWCRTRNSWDWVYPSRKMTKCEMGYSGGSNFSPGYEMSFSKCGIIVIFELWVTSRRGLPYIASPLRSRSELRSNLPEGGVILHKYEPFPFFPRPGKQYAINP